MVLCSATMGCGALTGPEGGARRPPATTDADGDTEGRGTACYDSCMRGHMDAARSAESLEEDCLRDCRATEGDSGTSTDGG